jgi:hypothetical protein
LIVRTIADVASQELVWGQPARLQRVFELHASDDVVAVLRFDKASLASGETAWQKWTFQQEGFWRRQVTIRTPDSDDAPVFKAAGMRGGALELSQGRLLHFGAANFWHSRWAWSDNESQAPLIHFKRRAGLLKIEGQVDIETKAVTYPELPLLVVLGWYLLIVFARNAAAAAAVR